ncbi:MAG: hypothetical protein KC912_13385 [Proteobacteria bacterium]|nr:hypothetical protein [Pseudomonadota bacterium]
MIEHYGNVLNEDNVDTAIHQALIGQARVPRPLYPMDGTQWVLELLDRAEGTPLHAVICTVLQQATRDADPDTLSTLADVLAARPEVAPDHQVYAAFARTATSDPAAAVTLAASVARQIVDGETSYSTVLRHHAANPELRKALASAYVIADHDWFVEQATAWLSPDVMATLNLLSAACAPLSLGELDSLANALGQRPFDADTAELIAAYFAEIREQPSFAERGLAIRWA